MPSMVEIANDETQNDESMTNPNDESQSFACECRRRSRFTRAVHCQQRIARLTAQLSILRHDHSSQCLDRVALHEHRPI